jgi:hypothetical protein
VASRQGTSLPSYQMKPSRSDMDMVISLIRFVVARGTILAVSAPIMKGAPGTTVRGWVLRISFVAGSCNHRAGCAG